MPQHLIVASTTYKYILVMARAYKLSETMQSTMAIKYCFIQGTLISTKGKYQYQHSATKSTLWVFMLNCEAVESCRWRVWEGWLGFIVCFVLLLNIRRWNAVFLHINHSLGKNIHSSLRAMASSCGLTCPFLHKDVMPHLFYWSASASFGGDSFVSKGRDFQRQHPWQSQVHLRLQPHHTPIS